MPSRRSFLTGALGAGLLAGCTDETTLPPPKPDADEVLAEEMRSAIAGVVALIDAVAAGRPKRVTRLAPTRAVHVAHLDLLGSGAAPPPAAGDLAAAQDALALTLKAGAVRAESGAFARALASMAAGTAQQAVVVRGLA